MKIRMSLVDIHVRLHAYLHGVESKIRKGNCMDMHAHCVCLYHVHAQWESHVCIHTQTVVIADACASKCELPLFIAFVCDFRA